MNSPGWGNGKPAGGKYWTKARIAQALRRYVAETAGPLPTNNHEWSRLKRGRMDLPTAGAILELGHSMARVWLALGVDSARVPRLNTRWSKADKTYLLEHAGVPTLERIAKDLNRSYASVKTMLGSKCMGMTARDNQGYLSANQVAAEYDTPSTRVIKLIAAGELPAFMHQHRKEWQIDSADLTPAIVAKLRAPKKTHRRARS